MAYFPDRVMPKMLAKETSKEVDNSPLIYNARDFNIHHREIRAIQRLLVGSALSSAGGSSATSDEGTTGGGSDSGGTSVVDILQRFIEIIELVTNRGFMGQYTGTVQNYGSVQLPSNIVKTQTTGTLLDTATTVNVVSTEGFPSSGTITKFNRLDIFEICTNGVEAARCDPGFRKAYSYESLIPSGSHHATNQEVITYDGKTDTQFLNCTRSINGSTAQSTTTPALIVSGKAAISFMHNMWGRGTLGAPNQFSINHDALLGVRARLNKIASRTRIGNELQDHIEIGWILTTNQHYEDVDVSQLFGVV